ncbi:UNVERIFIED_ORG: hypothetical protein GGD51_005151 [Rhizobium esperanzae]
MLPREIFDELYTFLQGIDEYVSSFRELTSPLDEDGLTDLLLSCLDASGRMPPGLSYPAAKFTQRVDEICEDQGYEENFDIRLEHERFTKVTEGLITQADFLIDLNYSNTSCADQDWRALYYIQAKKPRSLSLSAKIPYAAEQGKNIATLREWIGDEGVKYAAYCRPAVLGQSRDATLLAKLSDCCSDLQDYAAMEKAGIWINDGTALTVRDVLMAATKGSNPIAQFIAMHYRAGIAEGMRRFAPDDDSAEFDLLDRLSRFEDAAIKTVWSLTDVAGKPANRSIAKIVVSVKGPGPKPVLKSGGIKLL